MVGALNNARLTPEKEQERLNLCADDGWVLVSVLAKTHNTFYYLRRKITDECQKRRFDASRFDFVT